MKKLLQYTLIATLTFAMAASVLAYSEIHPVGTLSYNPDKAWNGYILVDVLLGKDSYTKLVDMNGNEVHRWNGTSGMPSKMMPGGQILTSVGNWSEGQQDKIALQQLDFNGKVLWEFRKFQAVQPIKGEAVENGKSWVSRQHHDFQREGMGTYYTPGEKPKDKGKTLILGHRNLMNKKIHNTIKLHDDVAYEVDWNGNIIWEYVVSDHVDDWGFSEAGFKAMQSFAPGSGPQVQNFAKEGVGFDWFHANTLNYVGPNRHYDAGDKRFHPENIIINSRTGNVFGIVDRNTKKVVWRVGPYYGKGTPDEKLGQIIGTHAVHMIAKGLPGEGNILLFDNGGVAGYGEPNANSATGFFNTRRDHSRVLEIDPVTKEIIWEYRYAITSKRMPAHFSYRFYSPFTSIAQRLPNGNTMITEGNTGRLFEVTQTLEMVWEYNVPENMISLPPLYRAYRVPYEYVPQLKKPAEVPVTPGDPLKFVIPNDKGELPEVMGK